MLITRYNADTLAWEVCDTDDNIVICEAGTQKIAKQIIKDYKKGVIK